MRRLLILISLLLSCAQTSFAPLASYVPSAEASRSTPRSLLIKDIDRESVPDYQRQARRFFKSDNPVYIQINSFGGSVYYGLELIQELETLKKLYPNTQTICAVDARAMSMALVILESPACDVRLATSRSLLLAHRASTQLEGNANQIQEGLDYLRALDRAIGLIIALRINMPLDQYLAIVDRGDWTLTADQALHLGFLDGLIEPSAIPPPL